MFQYGYDTLVPNKTQVPVLQLWGTGDKALHVNMAKGIKNFVVDFEEEYFEGVSHWIMQEIPGEVNAAIERYLNARK